MISSKRKKLEPIGLLLLMSKFTVIMQQKIGYLSFQDKYGAMPHFQYNPTWKNPFKKIYLKVFDCEAL